MIKYSNRDGYHSPYTDLISNAAVILMVKGPQLLIRKGTIVQGT